MLKSIIFSTLIVYQSTRVNVINVTNMNLIYSNGDNMFDKHRWYPNNLQKKEYIYITSSGENHFIVHIFLN